MARPPTHGPEQPFRDAVDEGPAWTYSDEDMQMTGPEEIRDVIPRKFEEPERWDPHYIKKGMYYHGMSEDVLGKNRKKYTKEELIETFKKSMYSSNTSRVIKRVEKLKVNWDSQVEIEKLLGFLDAWARNFLGHDDGTLRYYTMKLRHTLMRRAILRMARDNGNKYYKNLPEEEFDVEGVVQKLEKLPMWLEEKNRKEQQELLDLLEIFNSLHERLKALELRASKKRELPPGEPDLGPPDEGPPL